MMWRDKREGELDLFTVLRHDLPAIRRQCYICHPRRVVGCMLAVIAVVLIAIQMLP